MRKICTKCNVEKCLKRFYKKEKGRFGRHSECIQCLKIREKKNREANPEIKKIREELYRSKLKEKYADFENPRIHVKLHERSIMGFERYAEKKMQNLTSNLLNYAVRIGLVEKPSQCSVCQSENVLQAHHNDYSKPLEVVWVCTLCHVKFHTLK